MAKQVLNVGSAPDDGTGDTVRDGAIKTNDNFTELYDADVVTAAHIASTSNPHSVTKTQVGLGNVDNTSNATERAATATLTNKTLTAPVVNSPTGIVKADVGLGNVDNTSNTTERAATATLTNKTLTSPVINSPTGLAKADVGLSNVDNTADSAKPVSSAQQTALNLKEDAADKGAANGYASLGADSKIPTAQLPALAITDTFVVASQAAQVALTAEVGDICIRTDQNKSYILKTDPASTFSNWSELLTPTDTVLSVNSLTGAVTLTTANIADSANKRYVTDANLTVIGNTSGTNTGDQTVGTIATQDANAVNIDGGNIDGTVIGASTPAAVSATTLNTTGVATMRSEIDESSAYTGQLVIDSVTKSAGHLARILFEHDDHGSASIASDYESSGYGNLIFSTRGGGNPTERMRIAGNGNVGIGATSPAANLHIKDGSGNTEIKLQGGSSSANDVIAFLNAAGSTRGNITYDTDNDFVLFNVNAAERMRITSAGKVGIGTTAPALPLEVECTARGIATTGTTPVGALRVGSPDNNIVMDVGITTGNHPYIQGSDKANLATDTTLQMNPNGGLVAFGGEVTATGFTGTLDGVLGGGTPAAASTTTLNTAGTVVHNDAGAAVDFRVEGDTKPFLLFASGTEDKIGINTAGVVAQLTVEKTDNEGNIAISSTQASDNGDLGEFQFWNRTNAGSGSGTSFVNDVAAIQGKMEGTGNNSGGSLHFYTKPDGDAKTEKMTIDGSGNVGIGTTSPSAQLHLKQTSGDQFLKMEGATTNWGWRNQSDGTHGLYDFTNNLWRYLTSPNGNTTFYEGNLTQSKAGNTELMSLNTTGSVKGGIQCLSNATVRLGSTSNHATEIVQQNAVRMIVHTNGNVTPGSDNSHELGGASYRWTAVYATNGSIQTSDAREKTKVRKFTDNEIAAAKDLSKEIGMFQWLEAIEKKGKDKARQHVGFTVQKAIKIMEGHDLDPMAYGFICYNEWEDEFVDTEVDGKEKRVQKLKAGDRYSFRQDQLNLFIARGIEARIAKLEAKK